MDITSTPKIITLVVVVFGTLATCAPAVTSVSISDTGAVADGVTVNTAAIQKAIDQCHSTGGGVVIVPAGKFVSGTLELKDNVTLRLDENATLLGSTNPDDYRNPDPFIDGVGATMGYALIVASHANHVGIEGAGTIDGNGKALKAAEKKFNVRPFLLRWINCENVTLREVHLTNPGAWTLTFFQSHDVLVEHVTIRTRGAGLANNDGIDLDSCQSVRISNCDIESGDDALCLKTTSTVATRDITATGCTLSTAANAIKLGTESVGDFEKIDISNCQIRNTAMAGIAVYSVDGAHTHDVTFSNIAMDGVNTPISIRLGARLKTFRAGDTARPIGTIRDVHIHDVTAKRIGRIGMLINGIPDHPIENLNLENITFEFAGGGPAEDAKLVLPENEAKYPEVNMFGKIMPAYGIYVRHVNGIAFSNVHGTLLKPDGRPAQVLMETTSVSPIGFELQANSKGQ